MWNLKNKINVYSKPKQTHRYKTQTSSYQWGENIVESSDRSVELRATTTMYKIDCQQVYIVYDRKLQQLNRVQSVKVVNHEVVHLKIILQINYISFKK